MTGGVELSSDLTAWGTLLSGVGTLLGAIAVIYAARKAADTYSQWKRQNVEQRKMDYAVSTLAAAYRVQDAINGIRSTFPTVVEMLEAEDRLLQNAGFSRQPEFKQERQIVGEAMAARLEKQKSRWDSIIEVLPLARAFFDDDLRKALQELLAVRRTLSKSIEQLAVCEEKLSASGLSHHELWVTPGGRDSFSLTLHRTMSVIEERCLPVLRAEDLSPSNRRR